LKTRLTSNQIGTVVRLILSVVLLVILFKVVNIQQLHGHLLKVDLLHYGIGLGFYFLFIGIWAVRWHYIIRATGENISLRRAFVTTLVGNFFAMFLPEMVGSDVARMYEVSHERGTNANIVSTVLLDRVIGLVSVILMGLVALVLANHYLSDPTAVALIVGLLAVLLVGWVAFFYRRLMEWVFKRLFSLPLINRFETKIRSLYEALYHLHNQPRLLVITLLLALLVQLAEVTAVIFVARASNIEASPVHFFLFMPIIWLVTTLPITISGLGVREGAFAFFFAEVGVASSEAVALSLLFFSLKVISGMVGGLALFKGSATRYLRQRAGQSTKNIAV